MNTNRKIMLAALAIAVGLVGLSDGALAAKKAKKMSLQQAWRICKMRVDKQYGTNTQQGSNSRYLAGAACMKEHGYNL